MSEMRKEVQISPDISIDNTRIRYTEDGMAVTTLSLSPLPKKVTAAQLFDHFSTFGPVHSIRIISLGYATFGSIKFTHAQSAAQALDIKRHSFASHTTTLAYVASRHYEKTIKDDLPAELTNVTGTSLVDLNEDCLSIMFSLKYFGLMDLCSVAETCSRLKGVATDIFRREHRFLHLSVFNGRESIMKVNDGESVITIDEARRIFLNFGPALSEVKINSTSPSNDRTNEIMDLVITHCSNTLKCLIHKNCKFVESMGKRLILLFNQLTKFCVYWVDVEGDWKDLFANCESLVEITVYGFDIDCEEILRSVREKTFPKLRKIKFAHLTSYHWEDFILRHKALRTVDLDSYVDDHFSLLPVIAGNCKQLEELRIRVGDGKVSTVDFENDLKSLFILDNLKVLNLDCKCGNVTKFIQELHRLKSLESLKLFRARNVFEFIAELSQLKKLKVLRLTWCYGPKNLNLLGNLDRLTDLVLSFPDGVDPDFDVVRMVERLIKLESLEIRMYEFKMNKRTYLRIVPAVQARPDGAKRTIAINCDHDFILDEDDDNNSRIIKFL